MRRRRRGCRGISRGATEKCDKLDVCKGSRIAVGTRLTARPPHRTVPCRFPSYGSHLGYLTAKRTLAACRTRFQPVGHAFPARRPAHVVLDRVSLGPSPWLHQLRRRLPPLFAGFIATMEGSDFSCPCITGFGPPAFPVRTTANSAWPGMRSPGSRARSVGDVPGSPTTRDR